VKFSSQEFELKKIVVIGLTLASLSLTAGLAVAVPFTGNGGSIRGCVMKHGVLEVVKAGERCPRHSTPLSFNQVGPQGRQGIQGAQGPQGVPGSPGPATTTAPSGSTQRGWINVAGDATVLLASTIEFPLELTASPKAVEVPNGVPNPDPTHCPGSQGAPSAAPGYLCLYDGFEDNVGQLEGEHLVVNEGPTRFGAGFDVLPVNIGQIVFQGSWAVTAP
jgi:hypothetical protein